MKQHGRGSSLLLAAVGAFTYRQAFASKGQSSSEGFLVLVAPDPATGLPKPPQPYHYKSFMDWLRTAESLSRFSKGFPKMKWTPKVSEFDIDDAASQAKFKNWLKVASEDDLADQAISVAKAVNKYIFLTEVMLAGAAKLDTVGGPGIHLYILRRLLEAAQGTKRATFLDAGCGPGYLLMAWGLAAGVNNRAVGIDLELDVVRAAKNHLKDKAAWDHDQRKLPDGAKPVAFWGDALKLDAAALSLVPGSVDAVNLGVAVDQEGMLETLAPYAALMRNGGLLSVPVCKKEQPNDLRGGAKCDALFQIFQKNTDGALKRQENDPDIEVRFIKAKVFDYDETHPSHAVLPKPANQVAAVTVLAWLVHTLVGRACSTVF